jgi:integrase
MAVFKRGKYWYARVWWETKEGKDSETRGHFLTKKEAQMWYSDQKAKLENGFKLKSNPVFADYFWQWYQTYKEPHLRPETKKRYITTHKIIDSYFGKIKLKKISRMDWQKFINEAGKTRSNITIQLMNRQCRACVKNAVADSIIPRDFTYGVQINGNDSKTRADKVKMLSVAQIKKLLHYSVEHCKPTVISPYVIAAIILTGARIGEILALKWSNLNEVERTIQIHHSYSADRKELGPTKNKSSYRTIKVNKNLLDLLDQLKQNNSPFVFASSSGTGLPVTMHTVNDTLHTYMQHCKIPDAHFTIHSLRHCHVALLRYYHVDWYEISQRLGHENLTTTLKTYAYMIKEEKRKNSTQVEHILDRLTL